MVNNIRIGGVDYSVKVVDDFHMTETEKEQYRKDGQDPETLTKWGETTYHENSIKIWSGLSDQKKEQTLIHEMVHAVFHESGFDEENEDEVNRISLVLHQVLRDNDFSYILK